MKAWKVNPKDKFCSTVVFAETRGKARSLAMSTDCCEDVNFVDIEVNRFKSADKMCKGRTEMDWGNKEDRLFLVKECSWHCAEPDIRECNICVAKDFCETGIELLEEIENE